MRKVFAATVAIVVGLTMSGCVGLAIDDLTQGKPATPADTQPLETEAAESTDSPDTEGSNGSPDQPNDATFREQISEVGSENLRNKDAQDYGISVAKSICEQADAGVPADEIVDDVSSTIELTNDELFAVFAIGISVYCPQHEEALLSFD